VGTVFPGYQWTPFHRFLAAKLEALLLATEREESPRLVLSVPPRHGKSAMASVLLPAYALGRNPDWPLIHASYSADLSNDFSRQVRNLLREDEYRAIFPNVQPARDSRAVDRWGIEGYRGVFVSTGVGGPMTGRGSRLLVIDDAVRNAQDADSEVYRKTQRNWYASVARTRLEKGAGIVMIGTRWNLEDLIGYVTTGAGSDEPPAEEWEVVNIPAVAGEGDPLGREPGEPLWPEKYDVAALAAMQRQMPPRWWQALMQGSPVAAEGNLLHVAKIEHRLPPPEAKLYQAWDLAISEKTTADWSVGMTLAVDAEQNVYLVDRVRGRWGFNDVLEQIAAAAKVWDPVSIGIETTAFQAAVFQEASRRYLLPFREVKCDRDKVVRAQLLADRIDGGKVFANKQAPWWREWESEARDFPQGGHDDQVDATAHCVRMVSVLPWGADPGMQERLKKMYGMA
jgi:predicted phage terminase large subunit-like protein